jgi:ribonuclease D
MIPAPLLDTQVAAMVCGFGDQVSMAILFRR